MQHDESKWEARAVIAGLIESGYMAEAPDSEGIPVDRNGERAVRLTEDGRAAAVMLVNGLLLHDDAPADIAESLARLIARLARGDGLYVAFMEGIMALATADLTGMAFVVDGEGEVVKPPTMN